MSAEEAWRSGSLLDALERSLVLARVVSASGPEAVVLPVGSSTSFRAVPAVRCAAEDLRENDMVFVAQAQGVRTGIWFGPLEPRPSRASFTKSLTVSEDELLVRVGGATLRVATEPLRDLELDESEEPSGSEIRADAETITLESNLLVAKVGKSSVSVTKEGVLTARAVDAQLVAEQFAEIGSENVVIGGALGASKNAAAELETSLQSAKLIELLAERLLYKGKTQLKGEVELGDAGHSFVRGEPLVALLQNIVASLQILAVAPVATPAGPGAVAAVLPPLQTSGLLSEKVRG